MDPNQALRNLRDHVALFRNAYARGDDTEACEIGDEIVSSFEALDEWLSRGGFLPGAWRKTT